MHLPSTTRGNAEGQSFWHSISTPKAAPTHSLEPIGQALNENIAAGHCVNNTVVSFDFPTDNSIQSEISRINGVLVTLQNLRGPGVGCPAASTTLNARRKALQDQLASGNTNVPAATVTPVATVG